MIVDDGRGGLDHVIPLLAGAGLHVVKAPSASAASGLLAQTRPDVLIVEQSVLGPHASELQELRKRDTRIAVIMQCDPLGAQQRRDLIRQFNLDGIHERGSDPKGLLTLIESARAKTQPDESSCRADELRALVVVKLCHDLRSSLHVIRGYAELLADGDDPPEQDIAARLLAVSDAALALAQDCLDLTGLDSPPAALPPAAVDLDALLGDLHAAASREIAGRPLRFTIAVPFACACMRIDGEKLRATLLQLLGNALRFSRRGEIRLMVRAQSECTEFVLHDTRPLQDADNLSRGLRSVESADGDNLGHADSDIGLAIACRLSRMLDATLTASSGDGSGAIFVLRLPARMYRKQEAPAATLH